ncbi:hypothetical protein [Alteromonas lipotrueiana]|uniref:hypothetical protein n=1 Tax=Alteromonas lipotrueiana TaxID=2803815 RepID=UPI001C453B8D|nr:hypothetical protein [Alteromonas lipotrueiana]
MKLQLNNRNFKALGGWLVVVTLVSAFLFPEYLLWTTYFTMLLLVSSFYIRRATFFDKLKANYTVNISLGILILSGISCLKTGSIESAYIGISLTAVLVTFSYIANEYNAGNVSANSQELQKIDQWDVYSEPKTEVVTAVDGNVVSESMIVNRVASEVSYDDALNLLKHLYSEGKDPHAVSSRQYSILAPKMNHEGVFIGYQYDNESKEYPFNFDLLNKKK